MVTQHDTHTGDMEKQNEQLTDESPPKLSIPLPVPYSLFTKNERRGIVAMVALAAWFSTLSSFIYYPAIPMVAKDLDSSIAMINLTVTSYLVVSAIAPAVVGDAADMFGRRPLYAVTLILYIAANIGIAKQQSAVALLLLRMLQSAGISGICTLLPYLFWFVIGGREMSTETASLKQDLFPSLTVSSPISQRQVKEALSCPPYHSGK